MATEIGTVDTSMDSSDIISAVDNQPTTEQTVETAEPGTEVEPEATTEPEPTVDPLAEAEKLFAEEESAKTEVNEDNPLADEQKKGRAARTIQRLRAQRQQADREKEQYRQQLETFNQQVTQAFQAQQAQFQAQQQELAELRGRLAAGPGQEVDPVHKFKTDLQTESEQRFAQMLQERTKPLQDELEQLRAQRQQQEELARRREMSADYNNRADTAARQHLLRDFDEEFVNELSGDLGTLILNGAYSYNTDPASASKKIQRIMNRYALGYMRMRAREAKKKIAASQDTPTSQTGGRNVSNAKGKTLPSKEAVKKAGYKNELEMMFDQDGFVKA